MARRMSEADVCRQNQTRDHGSQVSSGKGWESREGRRAILTLIGGTAGSQALYVVALPALARIYTPVEFGILNSYQSILAILISVSAFRYEIATLVPSNNVIAANLLAASFIALILMTAFTSFALWFGAGMMGQFESLVPLLPYLWVLPIGQLGAGAYSILNMWMLRERAYRQITWTKLSQVAGQIVSQTILGLLNWHMLGLVLGDIIGRSSGVGRFVRYLKKTRPFLYREISSRRILAVSRRFKEFPLFSAPAAAINVLAWQGPNVLFAVLFGAQYTGLFGIVMRVCASPVMLVGKSVGDVYSSNCSQLAKENPDELVAVFRSTLRKLIFVALAVTVAIAAFSPMLFRLAFGASWTPAGMFGRYMAPFIGVYLCYWPFSNTLNILERQRLQLLWDSLVATIFGSGTLVIWVLKLPGEYAIGYFSIVYSIMYIIHIGLSYRTINRLAHKRLTK
jgi:O-antigen/teichoic acid export membrane protein